MLVLSAFFIVHPFLSHRPQWFKVAVFLHSGCGCSGGGRILGGYGESHHGDVDNSVCDVELRRETASCACVGREED